MSIADRLKAMGAGAAQSATGGWADEGYAKILDWLPREDEEIPREYAGGSAYNQYRDEARADNAALQAKYPLNYGAGQILGGAPAAIATGGVGAAGSVGLGAGLGALSGAGSSENTGMALAKDAARGGALGGGLAAGGQAAMAAAPVARDAMQRMLSTQPRAQMQPAAANVNMSYDPREAYYDKFTKGFERLKNKGSITPEAYGKLADTSKKLAATPRGEPVEAAAMKQLERKSIAPLTAEEQDAVLEKAISGGIPKQKQLVQGKTTFVRDSGETAEANIPIAMDPLEAAMRAQKTGRPGALGKGRPR